MCHSIARVSPYCHLNLFHYRTHTLTYTHAHTHTHTLSLSLSLFLSIYLSIYLSPPLSSQKSLLRLGIPRLPIYLLRYTLPHPLPPVVLPLQRMSKSTICLPRSIELFPRGEDCLVSSMASHTLIFSLECCICVNDPRLCIPSPSLSLSY